MEATLGYWNVRGLANPCRLLLEYTGTHYEDKHYIVGPEVPKCHQKPEIPPMGVIGIVPDFDVSQWTNVKDKLGLDFPNLPYLIDGDKKITQSNAILRYVGRKYHMCGETEEEKIRVDILENQLMDSRLCFAEMCYSLDFEKVKPEYLKYLPGKLKLYSQFLGNRKWFAGEKITYVDFIAYDFLDEQRMFEPKCFDHFPNLKSFIDRFEALDKVSAYMKSSHYLRTPIFWSVAKWGNKKL